MTDGVWKSGVVKAEAGKVPESGAADDEEDDEANIEVHGRLDASKNFTAPFPEKLKRCNLHHPSSSSSSSS